MKLWFLQQIYWNWHITPERANYEGKTKVAQKPLGLHCLLERACPNWQKIAETRNTHCLRIYVTKTFTILICKLFHLDLAILQDFLTSSHPHSAQSQHEPKNFLVWEFLWMFNFLSGTASSTNQPPLDLYTKIVPHHTIIQKVRLLYSSSFIHLTVLNSNV